MVAFVRGSVIDPKANSRWKLNFPLSSEGHKLKSKLFQVLPTLSVPEQKALCWESWAGQSEEKVGFAVEREGDRTFQLA